MTEYCCEKCLKCFSQKSHYDKHMIKKNPCIDIGYIIENKVNELIIKKIELINPNEKIINKMIEEIDFTKLLKKDLLDICKQKKIIKCSSKTKKELILLINEKNNIIENIKEKKDIEEKIIKKDIDKYNINDSTFEELQIYYDTILNLDKTTYKNSNDEPTPINCCNEMINNVPEELWKRDNLKILDPCCGNGNFEISIINKLNIVDKKKIMENIIFFNDINEDRLNNVRDIFCEDKYKLNLTNYDFLTMKEDILYDLIVANPPYAKLLENGLRSSKNHNLIKDFIQKSLKLLKPKGYLLFITPDNWMSYADRNLLIEIITELQIIHLDIHSAKKYFKKIGSSFTWYVIENTPYYKNINISGMWKKKEYISSVISEKRKYIPMLYNQIVNNILKKTIDNDLIEKFDVKTSSDLHHYTKKEYISNVEDEIYKYKLIHTPKQTVYSSRPHKFQDGYKIFISTTDKYSVFIDNCGMTQSIVFILCENKQDAEKYKKILEHPLYLFLNNICRWGNFNNIRILQHFPKPNIEYNNDIDIYNYFKITNDEIKYINENL